MRENRKKDSASSRPRGSAKTIQGWQTGLSQCQFAIKKKGQSNETPRSTPPFPPQLMIQEMIRPDTQSNRELLDLLRRIFVFDPSKRITAEQALRHAYFRIPACDWHGLIGTRDSRISWNSVTGQERFEWESGESSTIVCWTSRQYRNHTVMILYMRVI